MGRIARHLKEAPIPYIQQPEIVRCVPEGEPGAIGRPDRQIGKAALEVGQDPLGAASDRTYRDLLFSSTIGSVGDHPSVRRERRVVLVVGIGAVRQVLRRAGAHWNHDDIAAGGERRPASVRRQSVIDQT